MDIIEPAPSDGKQSHDRPAPGSRVLPDLLNLIAGAVLIYTGMFDRLWQWIEPSMPWRTGPPAQETLAYLALLALGWLVFNLLLTPLFRSARGVGDSSSPSSPPVCHGAQAPLCHNPPSTIHPPRISRLILRAGRFVVSGALLIIVQVLIRPVWPVIAIVLLLPAFLLSGRQTPVSGRLLNFAWCAAGIALSVLLINPFFQGDPRFVPRMALILTAWRIVGQLPPLRVKRTETWTPDWV